MSGNLKILVHKSWHVWKRENREKVARDERNYKEDNEKKEETEKLLLQEKNLELLVGSQSFESAERNDGESVQYSETPFRLFGDIEELDKKNRETKDLIQSRKDKEYQDKKKSGEAPWALGEGAAEKIGSVVPYWYANPSAPKTASSSSVIIKSEWGGDVCEEDARKKKDELRKHALDPMRGILKSTSQPYESTFTGADPTVGAMIKKEKDVTLLPSDVPGTVFLLLLSVYDQKPELNHTSSNETEKKEHRHKHKSRRHREDDKDLRGSEKRNIKSLDQHNDKEMPQSHGKRSRGENSADANSRHLNSNSSSSSNDQNSVDDYYRNPINVLRQKRMEREYAERKRASIVLAKADIFGPLNALRVGGLPDGREQRYNQQFHPSIAR